MTDSTEQQQHPGQFKPGQSGNPAGRPKGARHKVTRAIESLLEGEAEGLTRKAIDMALEGDITALRLCLDRIYPPRREAPVYIDLPVIESAADIPHILAALLGAAAAGTITPGEAEKLARIVSESGKALELAELEARLSALEQASERIASAQHSTMEDQHMTDDKKVALLANLLKRQGKSTTPSRKGSYKPRATRYDALHIGPKINNTTER